VKIWTVPRVQNRQDLDIYGDLDVLI